MQKIVAFKQEIKIGCGLDIHRDMIVATVQSSDSDSETRQFSTFTSGLIELRKWLEEKGVTHVVGESTGVYWKPVFNVLNEGSCFQLILVNPHNARMLPGHKTDKKDSAWLCKLLRAGLIKGSFIPPEKIMALREWVKLELQCKRDISREWKRIHSILQTGNIKLSSVISEISGASGRKIIEALIDGVAAAEELIKLCHKSLRATREQLLQALDGRITDSQRKLLKTRMEYLAEYEARLKNIEQEIEQLSANYSSEINHLMSIPGIGKLGAINLIAAIGVDMEQFPSDSHLASWAGLCPGNNESAGKHKNTRINKGHRYLKPILVQCAWSSVKSKNSPYKNKYNQLIQRMPKKKAIIAIAHKMIKLAYLLLKEKRQFEIRK